MPVKRTLQEQRRVARDKMRVKREVVREVGKLPGVIPADTVREWMKTTKYAVWDMEAAIKDLRNSTDAILSELESLHVSMDTLREEMRTDGN
jgi:hypothetical protein